MSILNLFFGVNGEFLKALLLLPVILLMYMLSSKLYVKRRRRSYSFLTKTTMALLIFNTVVILATSIISIVNVQSNLLTLFITGISNAGYITILYGLFRIQNTADLKTQFFYFGPAILTAATGLLSPAISNLICLFSLIAIITLFRKKLGRGHLITVASSLYGLSLIILTISDLFTFSHGAINVITQILPVVTYTIIMISLLEHSLVIMHSSYVSAITDSLTGLYNRRYFDKIISSFVNRNTPVNVIFSDIDNFKKINDNEGHKVGDEVLQKVASILMEEVNGYGVAGRYGGEEMVVLVQDPDIDMNELTEKMRCRIEKETIATASIGYRMFEANVPPNQLIEQADAAMYLAKQKGKNCVVRYRSQSSEAAAIDTGSAIISNG